MNDKGKKDTSRRSFLKKAGAGAAAVGAVSLSPRLVKPARAAKRDYILIGHPNPSTGGFSSFGEYSPWANDKVVDFVNKKGGIYIEDYGKKVPLKYKMLDMESDPAKAAEIASRLILSEKVDVMVASHTPDVCNPVSAVCERYKMPLINSDCPFEPWYMGAPYEWSFLIFWTVEEMSELFIDMWDQFADQTNKVVGGMWPNDPDGVAEAEIQHRLLPSRGFKIVDPGRFPFFMKDYTSFINLFRKEKVEIVTGELIPPDFNLFWRQCHQQGYIPKMSTVGKACMFGSVMDALGGDLAEGITCECWWNEAWPYKSPLTGDTPKSLHEEWIEATNRQPAMPLGFVHVLFDIYADVLMRCKSLDKEKILAAIKDTDRESVVGQIKFDKYSNCQTPLVGGQWVKGKRWPWELEVVFNKRAPQIPKTADMIFPLPRYKG